MSETEDIGGKTMEGRDLNNCFEEEDELKISLPLHCKYNIKSRKYLLLLLMEILSGIHGIDNINND